MKVLFRIFFISPEFVVLLGSIMIYLIWGESLDNFIKDIQFNSDVVKTFLVAPGAIFWWIFSKGNAFLQRDTENGKVLVQWDKYEDLKKCFAVGFIYAVFSLIVCGIAAITYQHSALHVISFTCGLLILSIVAISFYFAEGEIKDIIAKYK